MKKFIVVFATLSLLAGASYAFPGPDSIGMYASTTDPVTTLSTTAPFEEITVYLMVTNPSLGGVSGWECQVDYTGNIVAPAWTLAAGTDYNSDPTLFTVGIGIAQDAIRVNPVTNSLVIATFTGYVGMPTDEVTFYVRPFPGSVTFHPGPGYVAPDDVGIIQDLVPSSGGALVGGVWEENPVFLVNQTTTPVANEDVTWSSLKTLFK